MIPRIFHQIWLGSDPEPVEFVRYRDGWLKLHPGWQLLHWTEDNLPTELRRAEALNPLRSPVERSDILRLDLLWAYGGVYIDTDLECLRPIDDCIDGLDFFCSYVSGTRMTNTIMGAAAHHEIVDALLTEVQPTPSYGFDKNGTGPPLITRVVARYPDARVFEAPTFLPRTDAERATAYTVHHISRSWKDETGLRKSLHRAEKRLNRAQHELERLRRQLDEAQVELAVLRPLSGRLRLQLARTCRGITRRASTRMRRSTHPSSH